MSRVDDAWNHDPRALWGLIIEDEDTKNAAELGEISERLFANAQEAWDQNARLKVEVHELCGQLDHERSLNHASQLREQVLRSPDPDPGADNAVLRVHAMPRTL